ncbi:MAG TPA: hypothetical protein VKW06_09185 [Candidatus Angelobacter sp.]|nr:hypothetical protein [Candidatus Angelobacter sp.]
MIQRNQDYMRLQRYFSSLILMAAMAGPVALGATPNAAPGDDDRDHQTHRYYDRKHRDYHEWNERESHAYGRWETSYHRRHREFARRRRIEQEQYWSWRHRHADRD